MPMNEMTRPNVVANLADLARTSWDAGHQHFVAAIDGPTGKPNIGRVSDWSAVLDAVTAVGWRLHTWDVVAESSGKPWAYPLFVRP